MEHYKPLPDCLTIGPSNIEGLGLFATNFIAKDVILGITHYVNEEVSINFMSGTQSWDWKNTNIIRTPLGGFYNHSENPNCEKFKMDGKYWLKVISNIQPGEELTVNYSFYNPEDGA